MTLRNATIDANPFVNPASGYSYQEINETDETNPGIVYRFKVVAD